MWGETDWWKGFQSKKGANALIGLGTGLLQGPTFAKGLAAGGQGFMQGAELDNQYAKEEADALKLTEQGNVTRSWLEQQGFTDLVPLVDAGQADIAYTEAIRRMQPGYGQAGGGDERFFGTAVPMTDENGNIVLGQMSDQGRWQPLQGAEGYTPAPTTKTVDIGNFIVTQDVYGNELYRTPKSGDVPTGYGAPTGADGAIAPMPGSPQDRELMAGKVQAERALTTLETKNRVALSAVDTALQQASGWNTGNVMGNSGWVPGLGQGALDLGKTLETIKANIGFEELQTMRDNSPTGGALGQVTERELAFLQSTIANIEQSQSEEQLKRNLQTLREFLAMSQQQRRSAFDNQYGGQRPAAQGGQSGNYVFNPATGRLEAQ
jgi:hypothetical protein